MDAGTFKVTGWFRMLVPGCGVVPSVEVSAELETFSFQGTMVVSPDGSFTLNTSDTFGPAVSEGRITDQAMTFQKQYTSEPNEPPYHYRLVPIDSQTVWSGGWRRSPDQRDDAGEARIWLYPMPG